MTSAAVLFDRWLRATVWDTRLPEEEELYFRKLLEHFLRTLDPGTEPACIAACVAWHVLLASAAIGNVKRIDVVRWFGVENAAVERAWAHLQAAKQRMGTETVHVRAHPCLSSLTVLVCAGLHCRSMWAVA